MLNDAAVFTAGTGYIYTAPVGTAAPSRAVIRDFDPETFGTTAFDVVISGSPDGGSFKLQAGNKKTDELAFNADAAGIQTAVEKLDAVGAGNVSVSATDTGFKVILIGKMFGKDLDITVTDASLTGGTSPKVEITSISAVNGWEPIGHTSLENPVEPGNEGGESEVKGSWQKKQLKEVETEAPVDYIIVRLLQFDPDTLAYYYGENASKVEGVYAFSGTTKAVEKAFLMVMVDGSFRIGMSAAKASFRRDDSIELDPENFAELPVRATFVSHPGRPLFEWTTPAK